MPDILMPRGPGRECPCCGAGKHNGYVHDQDCLIHVPRARRYSWRRGWADKTAGRVTTKTNDTYQKGARCAKKMKGLAS